MNRLKLIDEAKCWWKMYSTHAYALSLGIAGGLLWFARSNPDIYQKMPVWVLVLIGLFCIASYGIGRVVKQDSVSGSAALPGTTEENG